MVVNMNNLEVGLEGDGKSEAVDLGFWRYANFMALAANIGVGVLQSFLSNSGGESSEPTEAPPARTISFFMPAVYAFSIWIVIYGLEITYVVWQLFQCPGKAPNSRLAAIRESAPWWCMAHLFTVFWLLTPSFLIETLELTVVAISMGLAHSAVPHHSVQPDFLLMSAGITMHFGWVTAATLLSWNMVVATYTSSVAARLAVAVAGLVIAVLLGAILSMRRKAPLLAATVAWAVIAIGVQSLTSSQMAAELGSVTAIALGVLELGVGAGLGVVAYSAYAIPA